MRARIVHHSEYLALALLLIGAAVWQKDQITGCCTSASTGSWDSVFAARMAGRR